MRTGLFLRSRRRYRSRYRRNNWFSRTTLYAISATVSFGAVVLLSNSLNQDSDTRQSFDATENVGEKKNLLGNVSGDLFNDGSVVSKCDTLSAHPDDAEARSEGVSDEQLSAHIDESLVACRQAVDIVSGARSHARLFFQYGRILKAASRLQKAQAQLSIAAEMGHAGAMAYLVEVYMLSDTAPSQDQYREYIEFLHQATAMGYEPAASLALKLETKLSSQPIVTKEFDATGFSNPVIMQAAYIGDFSKLHSIKTELIGDHMGLKHGLALYTRSFADQFSAIWTCAGFNVPGLSAAAKRAEIEHLSETIVTDPASIVAGGLEWIGTVLSDESIHNPSLGSVFSDTVKATTRQQEAVARLREQGQFDAVYLANNFGCDHAVTMKVTKNLGAYFHQ